MNLFAILRDSLHFYRLNVKSILLICLPLILPIAIGRVLVDTSEDVDSALLFYGMCILLFQPTYSGALILFMSERRDEVQPQVLNVWLRALKLWPLMVFMGLLLTFSVMLGMVLLILPGIWILIKLSFAQFLLIARGLGPVEALKASFDMTKGHFWLAFFCVFGVSSSLILFEISMNVSFGVVRSPLLSLAIYSLAGLLQTFALTVLFRLFTLVEKAGGSPAPADIDDPR
jgi:hypothetical protein